MYNRYIPNGTTYTRVMVEDTPPVQNESSPPPQRHEPQPFQPTSGPVHNTRQSAPKQPFNLPPFLFGKGKEEFGGLSNLLKSLKLENLDSGDVLLLLIVLFLLLEGDNLELVIALGLVLIMGLTDDKEKKEKQ